MLSQTSPLGIKRHQTLVSQPLQECASRIDLRIDAPQYLLPLRFDLVEVCLKLLFGTDRHRLRPALAILEIAHHPGPPRGRLNIQKGLDTDLADGPHNAIVSSKLFRRN